MELVKLSDSAYQLFGGSNAGLLVQDGQALLIDTGLDKDTAKKILRIVDAQKWRVAAVLITHAHADHFGGAAAVHARTGAPVYATALEAAVVANPIFEPLYLFSGAWPAAELLHKFTLADACPVAGLLQPGPATLGGVPFDVIPAPGHAPGQVMIAGGGVCFVADACFAPEVLRKHGIPFYADVDRTLATLEQLAELDGRYTAFVPGHGGTVPRIGPWAAENGARIREIREAVAAALADNSDISAIIQSAAARLGVSIPNPVIYWLTQTTVLACLRSLQSAGRAAVTVHENTLRWHAEA